MLKWLKIYCIVILLVACVSIGFLIYAISMDIREMTDAAICGVIFSLMLMTPIECYLELKCIIGIKRRNKNDR